MKMSNQPNSRIGLMASSTVALILGPFCLLWYAARQPDYGEEMVWFLATVLVQLLATACAVILGKTWKRWLLLLIAMPCVLNATDRVYIAVKVLSSR
jgi:hypothetical protein